VTQNSPFSQVATRMEGVDIKAIPLAQSESRGCAGSN
jgi:hypothetical protein